MQLFLIGTLHVRIVACILQDWHFGFLDALQNIFTIVPFETLLPAKNAGGMCSICAKMFVARDTPP